MGGQTGTDIDFGLGRMLMDLLYSLHLACNIVLITAVLLSFIKDDFWVFRVLEYPRFQKFIACCLVLLLWLPFHQRMTLPDYLLASLLFGCSLYLFFKILPYTALAKKEMLTVMPGHADSQLRIFTCNVLQYNARYQRLLEQIKGADPDMVFLVETDEKWAGALEELHQQYGYRLAEPRSNTYGLLFYSRFRIENAKINHLAEPEVPSVELVVQLPAGTRVQVYGLHPKPPVPKESERSTAKDKELMKIAALAKDSTLPVVVMGDLNDVAWSYTTELFRKTGRLLDPRRGRGFFSTYNAKSLLIRFPLDYIFCSNDFGLISMKRLPKNGSDHFAMFIHLQYDENLKHQQKRPEADHEEKLRAQEMRKARAR